MNLNLSRRTKRRLPKRDPQPMVFETRSNAERSSGFTSDTLYPGRRLNTLNVLDEGVREALDIVIDTSIPIRSVVWTLERLVEWRGKPDAIRVQNSGVRIAKVRWIIVSEASWSGDDVFGTMQISSILSIFLISSVLILIGLRHV